MDSLLAGVLLVWVLLDWVRADERRGLYWKRLLMGRLAWAAPSCCMLFICSAGSLMLLIALLVDCMLGLGTSLLLCCAPVLLSVRWLGCDVDACCGAVLTMGVLVALGFGSAVLLDAFGFSLGSGSCRCTCREFAGLVMSCVDADVAGVLLPCCLPLAPASDAGCSARPPAD